MKFYSVLDKCKNVISDVIILKYVKRRLHLFEQVHFIFIIEFSMLKLHLKVFNCSQVSDYMPAVSYTPSVTSVGIMWGFHNVVHYWAACLHVFGNQSNDMNSALEVRSSHES